MGGKSKPIDKTEVLLATVKAQYETQIAQLKIEIERLRFEVEKAKNRIRELEKEKEELLETAQTLQQVIEQKDLLIEALRQKNSLGDVSIGEKKEESTMPRQMGREQKKDVVHGNKQAIRKASTALLQLLRKKYVEEGTP